MYFVYILLCKDKSLYTGITTDLDRRVEEHKSGKGAKFTRSRRVSRLVYKERHKNRSTASKREAEIKSWKRPEKLKFLKSKHVSLL